MRVLLDANVLISAAIRPSGSPGLIRDPDDDAVLSAAVEGRADVFVTGDDDLLALEEYEGIAILPPRECLEMIKG